MTGSFHSFFDFRGREGGGGGGGGGSLGLYLVGRGWRLLKHPSFIFIYF